MKTKLFTKKIYLGLLMTFVLALGVQGIVDALTPSVRYSQPDLKALNQNSTITVSGIRTTPNNTTVSDEALTITISLGTATISSGGTTFNSGTSWTEDTTDNRLELNDDLIPSSVTITLTTPGETTVTVSWTTRDGADASATRQRISDILCGRSDSNCKHNQSYRYR